MKRILVTGCGGAPTINFVRSLRETDPEHKGYFIVGVDYDIYNLHRNECDKSYLCPATKSDFYIDFLLEIIKREKIDFIHSQPEIEVYTIGKHRDKIIQAGVRLFMPKQEIIEILRDKFKSYLIWKKAGIKVPKNIKIDSEDDLKRAFAEFGGNIWIRETTGAAGKGSLSNPTYELAKASINCRNGWGNTVAAERLTEKTTTWQSLWENGVLVIGQGRDRLNWEMANRTQSGVTGITGTGKINNDSSLAEVAMRCIKAVDQLPHGIFSVDFTYDKDGVPNPTEINIGKFFTTHYFITRAGANMPRIMVELAFGEYRGDYNIINPCRERLYWIRGMDKEPVMVEEREITKQREIYEEILKKIES